MVNETANEFQRPQLESMNRRWEAMRHGLSDRRMDLETANAVSWYSVITRSWDLCNSDVLRTVATGRVLF